MTRSRPRPHLALVRDPSRAATGAFARPVRRVDPEPEPPAPSETPAAIPLGGMAQMPMVWAPPRYEPLPGGPADPDRATSYRVFAVITGLLGLVCLSVVVAMGLTLCVVSTIDAAPATEQVATWTPPSRPAHVYDTGEPAPPPPPPVERPVKTQPQVGTPPPPPPPETGPAEAVIEIPGGLPFNGVQLACPISGFRERATFVDGVARIPGVPREQCTVSFTGGPPARNTIRGGEHKRCTFPSGQAVCQ